MSSSVFVGMDVLQASVAVAVQPGTGFQISNDEQGMAQAGKAKKPALTACMRKRLTILKTMAKSWTP